MLLSLPGRDIINSATVRIDVSIEGQEEPMAIFQTPAIGPEEEAALARIDGLRRELRTYVAEPRRWSGSVRRVLAAKAIQGSNSIEGYNISDEDAVGVVDGAVEPTSSEWEDWEANQSYSRAMTYVLQLAKDEHFDYTAALIRSLHFMMTEYSLDASPGLWRPGPIWVRNDATGEIVYDAPEHGEAPGLVEELVAQLREDQKIRAMVRGAMAHLNLVMIHPFRDGNGRMARCLQTLVLVREGILNKEFCSIEEYLGRNTHEYYEMLGQVGQGQWHPENDARPWVRFCLKAHYIQAASVLRRVRESERMFLEFDRLAENLGLPYRTTAAMFDAALGLRVRNAMYRSVLEHEWGEPLSNQTATTDLGALVRAGLLVSKGQKRGTYYVAAGPIKELYEGLRAARTPLTADDLFSPGPTSLEPQPVLFPTGEQR
jgi:Fic family protein